MLSFVFSCIYILLFMPFYTLHSYHSTLTSFTPPQMEKINLENPNDAIKRESLFKKAALKALAPLAFTRVPHDYSGVLLRTRRELDDLEKKFVDKDAEKKRKAERRIEKKIKEEEEESSVEYEPELTNKERKEKNKKKYPKGVTKGQRRKRVKSKKKANRRKRS